LIFSFVKIHLRQAPDLRSFPAADGQRCADRAGGAYGHGHTPMNKQSDIRVHPSVADRFFLNPWRSRLTQLGTP
jgi:hypothetical protein